MNTTRQKKGHGKSTQIVLRPPLVPQRCKRWPAREIGIRKIIFCVESSKEGLFSCVVLLDLGPSFMPTTWTSKSAFPRIRSRGQVHCES